jgi:hypothetical protein
MKKPFFSTEKNPTLILANSLMAAAAAVWLPYQFYRLLWQPQGIGDYKVWPGAIDFKTFYQYVETWFSGTPLYGTIANASYPPASHVLLWPLMGWLPPDKALWFFTATMISALACIVRLSVRICGATFHLERHLLALIPLSMYATGAVIGNGQITIHVLTAILGTLYVMDRKLVGLQNDIAVAALFLFALVKPSIAIPFFWIVLFASPNMRPALMVVCGYGCLTLFAALFQNRDPMSLVHAWLGGAQTASDRSSDMGISFNNLHQWSTGLGLREWYPVAAIVFLLLLGCWAFRYRKNDIWELAGVTAFVSRLWTFHGWYDDLLILLPILSLIRIAKGIGFLQARSLYPLILVALLLSTSIAPGAHYLLPAPWNQLFVAGQAIIWIVALVFLLITAERAR